MNNSAMLRQINQCLSMHVNTLLTFPVYDPQNIKEDIDSFSAKVKSIVASENLSSEDRELISSINDYSKLIYCILSERIALQEGPSHIYEEVDESHQQVTGTGVETTEESEADKKSNRRLIKKQLDILEKWYLENLRHPYLTRESIQELMTATSLSKCQVQNWYVFF
ncbi:HMLALPHA2 [[Candida] subhashii]|uniref:HMLALPHA2 n=1 Tax=[Candida] subhashii TaxID=561895 RepID=A0A8J5QHK7_9ASCO|nr:HMLALPHA2 [[Candida] subhashii]KAG7661515.1 HMLALPHA2 [[Candida] subhashii]